MSGLLIATVQSGLGRLPALSCSARGLLSIVRRAGSITLYFSDDARERSNTFVGVSQPFCDGYQEIQLW